MTRDVFIKRILRLGLLALIAAVVFALKDRIVAGENCSSCPVYGSCPGKSECIKN